MSLCPELAVGFPVPRPPAEIIGGSAADILDGRAQVHEASGRDVTELFQAAAQHAVDKAPQAGVGQHQPLTTGFITLLAYTGAWLLWVLLMTAVTTAAFPATAHGHRGHTDARATDRNPPGLSTSPPETPPVGPRRPAPR